MAPRLESSRPLSTRTPRVEVTSPSQRSSDEATGKFLPKKNSAGLQRQAGSIALASHCRLPRLPSPAACVRWPGSFSMRQACPGQKFSSAAALRRSLRRSWPGSALLHWPRACCHLARLTWVPSSGFPICRVCRFCFTQGSRKGDYAMRLPRLRPPLGARCEARLRTHKSGFMSSAVNLRFIL